MPASLSLLPPDLLPPGLQAAATAAGLSIVAEMGDKSQLVCILLAARHGAARTTAGAVIAFAALSALAVGLGAGLGAVLPAGLLRLASAGLFAVFGIQSWRAAREAAPTAEEAAEEARTTGAWGPVLAIALSLAGAELGDKTWLAVATLAGSLPPWPTWLGATLGLSLTAGLGAWMGARLAGRLPLALLRRAAAVGFLAVAAGLALDGLAALGGP